MTKRTYTQKDGTIWEWEETQESAKALETYWRTTKENESKSTNS